MGNTSSSGLSDSPITTLCCFGSERKGFEKSQELLEEEEVSSMETSSILSTVNATSIAKSDESIMVEKRSSEMIQLDKALIEGYVS